jgi:hypothetical protein
MTSRPLVIVLTAVNFALLMVVVMRDDPASGQGETSVLRGQTLELVDARGQVRAQFNVESNGAAVFRMRDQTGSIRVKLGASRTGSGLLLNNNATEPGVHMLAQRGSASLTLRNRVGRQRVLRPPAR